MTHYLKKCFLLLEARIGIVTEKSYTHYYPLLFFHVGIGDTARSSLKNIMKDYTAIRAAVKGLWSVGSSFISLPGQRKGILKQGAEFSESTDGYRINATVWASAA